MSYFRRLLDPPLPGDGLLLIGFLEGLVGWPLSAVLVTTPSLAVVGPLASVVALWAVLTAGIIFVGVVYTAPMVRRKNVWVVWGVLNLTALGVNGLAVFGLLPEPFVGRGYWHPWLAAIGAGYLTTALLNVENPQVRASERVVYGIGGVAALGTLVVAFNRPSILAHAFLVGGVLHLVPIGFDVAADPYLVYRA